MSNNFFDIGADKSGTSTDGVGFSPEHRISHRSMQEATSLCKHVFDVIAHKLGNHDAHVRQIRDAFLTATNVFIGGPPGEGKSYFLDTVLSHIHGARVFSLEFNTSTTVNDIFGFPDLDGLNQGIWKRNITGTLADCDIGQGEEIFNGDLPVVQAMHRVLKERQYLNGVQVVQVPLHSFLATSNIVPEDPRAEATYDRLTCKALFARSDDPGEDLIIVERYLGSHGGELSEVPEGDRIDINDLRFLHRTLRGKNPDYPVISPPYLEVLSGLVARRYAALYNERLQPDIEFAVSRRTRLTGHYFPLAAAMLDLKQPDESYLGELRYVLPVVGDEEAESVFEDALASAHGLLPRREYKNIDRAVEAMRHVQQLAAAYLGGARPDLTILQRIAKAIGLLDDPKILLGDALKRVRIRDSNNEIVERVRAKAEHEVYKELARLRKAGHNDILPA